MSKADLTPEHLRKKARDLDDAGYHAAAGVYWEAAAKAEEAINQKKNRK